MLRLLLLVICFTQVFSQYIIPEVTLEAFTPKGFRAYIPNIPGLQLFAFHGTANSKISPAEPGEITGKIDSSTGSYFIFVDPNLELHVGDTINYWIFIQHNRLGYRKDNLSWKVTELGKSPDQLCVQSLTSTSNGKELCKGTVILEDNFQTLNTMKWKIEKYIPFDRPNYEFNYYDPQAVKIENSKLVIRPVVKPTTGLNLDLKEGCTSNDKDECYNSYFTPSLVPQVMSGKLTSNIKFRYGVIEIRAKLPAGDWIFPEISLIPIDAENGACIQVSLSRGNEDFHGDDGKNLGSNLLYGGPMLPLSEEESNHTMLLRSTRNHIPYNEEMHTYTLIWLPGEMRMLVDDIEYGKVNINESLNEVKSDFDVDCELVIAVGVGGIRDFPDGFMSGTVKKPWEDRDRMQNRDFLDKRNVWEQTWNDNELQVEYVKVTSI